MRPNFISGMKLKGIGRHSKEPFYARLNKSWLKFEARVRKDEREKKQRERANRPFEE